MLNFRKTLLIGSLFIFENGLVAGDNFIKPALLMAGLLKTVHRVGEIETPIVQDILPVTVSTPHKRSPEPSKSKHHTKRYDKKIAARRENFNTRY